MDYLAFTEVIFSSQTLNLATHAAAIDACSPGKTIQLQISSL